MQTQAIKCSICGAPLSIDTNFKSNITECPYCGNTINITITEDSARTEQTIANQESEKQETELLLKYKKKVKIDYDTAIFQAQEGKNKAKKYIIVGVILCLIGLALFPFIIAGVIIIIIGVKQSQKASNIEQEAYTIYEMETKAINDKLSKR